MTYQDVLQLFWQNSNQTYNDFNSKIINSGVPTIGCTVPFVRSVAKKYHGSLEEVLAFPTHQYFEVDLFKGMVVVQSKMKFDEKHTYLMRFANTLENWAVCDCNTVKVPANEAAQYFQFFCSLCTNSKPFVCRYGLVNLLTSFLDDAHIDAVFNLLSQVTMGHYYVDMAVAWLVATAFCNCRTQTVHYLEADARKVLNVFAYNKALQKIRDSLRVSSQDKQWTKTLKR